MKTKQQFIVCWKGQPVLFHPNGTQRFLYTLVKKENAARFESESAARVEAARYHLKREDITIEPAVPY